MSEYINDLALDAALDYIIDNCDAMRICSSDVTTSSAGDYTKVTGDAALTADITVSAGDLVKSDHTTGRKLTMAAKTAISITATGTAVYVALIDTVNSRVLSINETISKALTAAESTDTTEFEIRLPQPA